MNASNQSSGTRNAIFVQNGQHMSIFVEAARVQGRHKLVRDLEGAGAHIVYTQRDARIILVDPTTTEGMDLATAWPEKIVLDTRWAREALARGACALDSENWGGRRVHAAETDTHRASSIPLPTPRQTPVTETPVALPHVSHSAPNMDPSLLASLSQMLQTFPIPVQPSSSQTPAPFSQLPSSSVSQLLPQQVPPAIALPGSSGPASGSQADLLKMIQDALLQGGLNAPTQQLPMNGASTSLQAQFYPHQWPSNGVSSAMHPPPTSQTVHPQAIGVTNAPPYTPPKVYASSSALDSSTSSRLADSPGASTSRKRKGGTIASSSSANELGERVGAQPRQFKQRRFEEQEDDSMDGTPSPTQPAPRKSGPRKANKREVFLNDRGGSLSFYVQPSLKLRQQVVDSIKNFSGTITAEVSEADFVVLAQNADHFESALRSAVALDIPAVKASFVIQCVTTGSLADPDDFSFDGEVVRRKRGAPLTVNLAKMREASRGEKLKGPTPTRGKRKSMSTEKPREPSPESPVSEQRTPVRPREPDADVAMSYSDDEEQPLPQDVPIQLNQESIMRSPSPPPPIITVHAVTVQGRNIYVEEEREYWPRYVAHVLKYEPDFPTSRLAQGLSKKLPRHTSASWNTMLGTQEKAQMLELRKRAQIAARKAASAAQTLGVNIGSGQSARPSIPIPRMSAPRIQPVQDDVDHDLEVVVEFLLNGGAEGISDDEVWDVLAQKETCRSQASWAAFWVEHGAAITAEMQRRVQTLASDDTEFQIKEEVVS